MYKKSLTLACNKLLFRVVISYMLVYLSNSLYVNLKLYPNQIISNGTNKKKIERVCFLLGTAACN